ncbi:MAG: serine/threonine protein kinase [Oceanobacter sp.]
MSDSHPYASLTQEDVMDAIESLGYWCDARVFPLNSYENRVYQVGIEESDPLIAKFYRPGRWSAEQIQEEHDFLEQLLEEEIPVVAPIRKDGQSLFKHKDFLFALFPRRGGHAPELARHDDLELIGRWLARLHQVGGWESFQHRPKIRGTEDLKEAAAAVLASGLMPSDYEAVYESLIRDLTQWLESNARLSDFRNIRLHGDLHCGNLLLRDDNLYLVDFDDCVQGPAMQDIWMLLSGDQHEQSRQLEAIRKGYEMFREFPYEELKSIEILRTLRICRYAAWLCTRWDDPAFPAAFSWFEGHRFWSDHVLTLREQLAALQSEPLTLASDFNF